MKKPIQSPNQLLLWCLITLSFSVICTRSSAQKVGIGSVVFAPQNMLDVKGAMVIGNTYSGVNAAPANGLLIEGNTGIGTVAPVKKLDVRGDIQVGDPLIWSSAAQDHFINFGDQNYVYIGEKGGDDLMEIRAGKFYFSNGNVGIGIAAPTQKLDIVGNVKFSGALMPNNLPGTNNQVLQSKGAGVAPVWGPGIDLWYYPPADYNWGTTYTITATGVTGCTVNSYVTVTLNGEWLSGQPNVTIHHVEAQNGQVRWRMSNNGLTTYLGMDFNICVIR